MAQAFNLTAQLNLRGPSNIKNIVADIKRQLGTVQGTVNFTIDPKTTRNVTQLESALRNLNSTFSQTQNNASAAANAIRTFNSAIGNISSATNNVNRSINNASSATQNLGKQTTTAAQQTRVAIGEMEEFGKQSALAVRRFAAFSSVTSVIFAFTNALTKGMTAFVAFDREFVKLQQVTDSSASQLKGLSDEITNLSKNFGVASSDLMTVASTLAQAGLSAKDTERALKALALTDLAPSFDSMNETVEGSIALMRQFNIGAGDLEKALGSVNSVAAVFAVEASDIITAIQRTGGVFANASKGVSQGTDALNEFIAVFTSIRQTTRESAETIATGLRTIFTRVQRESTIEALKEFGVTLTDLEGKFVGPYEAVRRLSEGLARLDPRDLKFSRIVEELGGFRQIGKVIPLIQQFSVAQEALGVAQRGQGSLAQDAIKAQLSLANQMSKVREEFLALMRDIGNSDTFQAIAKSALGFTSILIKVADTVKGILPVLAIMGAGKAASGIAQFATGFMGGLKRGPDGQAGGSGGGQAGGGGGILSRITGGGSNQANIGVRELILVSDALRNNTSSLGLNTAAIQDLTRAISSSRSSPFANGGPVRKFARGGVVPGSGNRDTVPAMLQPGEFVIRKKAVETIGSDQLHGMNKYGGGGSIRAGKSNQRQKFAQGGIAAVNNFSSADGVYDGDTLKINVTPTDQPFNTKTRLLGVDAFEVKNKGGRDNTWQKQLGLRARQVAMDHYATKNNKSILESLRPTDKGTEKYGRILLEDNELANKLKANKLAVPYGGKSASDLTKQEYEKTFGQSVEETLKLPAAESPHKKKKIQTLMVGGKVQKFMDGGKAESTPFGTGETKFPKRITNAYAKELQKKLDKERVDNTFNPYPSNERISIDPEEVSQKFQSEPFDRKRFLSLFNTKISRNELVGNLSDFAKFIGLPGEDLAKVLPQTIDFGGELQRSGNRGTFSRDSFGTQGYDNKGLGAFGFAPADEQDLFGYQKLLDEKTKEIQKIIKTPTRTFDDGSFTYDSDAFIKAMDEKSSLGKKISDVMDKRAVARKGLMEQKKGILDSTGRGFVSMASNAFEKNQPKNVLYHELTHQLLNSLRTKSEDSFTKYKERVSQLFNGDNDDLADAFDALGGSYNSADIVYGRSYKNGLLDNVLQDLRRKTMDAGGRSADPDLSKEAYSMWVESGQKKNAREYRPINPKINDLLLKGGQKQETLDKVEDYGKEEFLTTLIQHAPKLDSNMQGILDSTLNELLGNAGIQRQQYAEGGKVTRNLGYIDFDVINDPANAEVIEQAMKKAGVDGPRNYTGYLTDLAIKARKEKSLNSLKALYGVAGSGKSSIVTGRGSNDIGTLRQTNRFPILTPEDITKASEVMLLTSTVSQDKLEGMLQEVDRAYTLSSTTKEEKDRILKQRTMRDVSGVGLFGRAAGSTTGAPLDTAKEEALLEDRLGSKSVVLGRKDDGGLRRKTGNELVEATKKKLGLTWGGFAPTTAGHESMMEAAKAAGIPYQDFIALVGSDEAVDAENYRTAVFDKDFRLVLAKAGFGSKGASVLPKDFGDMSVPLAFDMGEKDGRRQVTLAGEGSMAFVADKTEKQMEKYKKAGYGVSNLQRTGGISGTQVRDLLLDGNLKSLQQVVSPGVFSLLKANMAQLQNRSNVLPTLIEQAEASYNEEVSGIDQQLAATGITRADNKKAETDPEYAARLELYQSLKAKKKKLETKKSFEPYRLLRQLADSDPAKYGLKFDTDSLGSTAPAGPSSAIQQAILAKVAKETSVKKSSGILPAQGSEILKRFGAERLPNDPSFGPFSGKTVRDTSDGGKLKYWNSTFRPETKADKLAYYTATRDYLIDKFNQSQGTQKTTTLAETTSAVLSSKQLGLVGLNPLGYTGLLGPETWNLGTDPSGRERSIDASIIQRGLPYQYQNVIDYLSGQTSELVDGAVKLLGISPKKLSQKERETLGQGNIEGALLEQIFGSAGATVLNDALRTRPIDFPLGIGSKAAKIFGIDPNIPTEVKRTIDSRSRGKAVEEFQRYFRQQYSIPDPEKVVQKLAAGGSIQDTVPALLTPGEFVVNKKAASRIGGATLNRMNRADKIQGYNKGGYVGIQKFAEGGTPSSVGAPGGFMGFDLNDKMLNQYISKTTRSLQLFTATFDAVTLKVPTLLSKGIEYVSTKFFGMGKGVVDLENALADLENSMPGLASAIIDNGSANRRTVVGQESLISAIASTANKIASDGGDWSAWLKQTKANLEQNTLALTGKDSVSADAVPAMKSPLVDVGNDGRKLQENSFLLYAKEAKRQELDTKKSEATDPDEIASLTEEMKKLYAEISELESVLSQAGKEFDSLTDNIDTLTINADNAGKALRESISAEFESLTGNKPSEAKIDEIQREAMRTGGKVKTDKGDINVTDRTTAVVNAKNDLESGMQARESKFGTAKKSEDFNISAKDFVSRQKANLRQEQEKKDQLTTKVSTASGGEKILLRDQIAETDGAIAKLEASIEAAEQAYSIAAKNVKEASSAETAAQDNVAKAEQSLVDALKSRITDWESLSDERKSQAIEQVRETGQITDKSGKTQSFDNSGVKAADSALAEARDKKIAAEADLEVVSGKSSDEETAEREVVESAMRRADADAYVALMAKQNGMSVSQFTNKLKKDIGSTFMALKNDVPKAVGAARAGMLQNRDKLGSADEATRNTAKQNIQDSLRKAIGSSEVSGIDDTKLQAMVDRLADNLSDTSMSMADAIASTDGLSEALAEATSQARLQARAIEEVSAESGVAADRLEELADGAVGAAQNRARTDELGRRMQSGLGYAAMGVSVAGQLGANMFDPNSREGAVGSAVVGGASQTAGVGLALASQAAQIPVVGPAIAGVVAVGTAAAVVAGAFKDAHNATREFQKTLANKNLQIAMDKTAAAFEEFDKDIKNVKLLDDIGNQLNTAGANVQAGQDIENNVPKAFWLNMFDALGANTTEERRGAADRSKILEKEGIAGYLRSRSDKEYTSRTMASYAPEQAVEQAKTFKPVADATLQLFENKLKTGTSMEDVMKDLKDSTGAPTQLAKNIALSNSAVQEQILLIQQNNGLKSDEKQTIIDGIVAKEAERKATLDLERTLREVEINKLNKATNAYVNSLERTFKQMEASIGKASFELDQLSVSSEAYNAALSGSAKSSQVNLKSMNVLQNSRAYSGSERDAAGKQAGEFFGTTSGNLEGMLKVGDNLENNIISTINRTIQEDPNASEEKISAKIRTNTESTVQDAGLSKDLSAKLGKEVQKAVTDIRKGGDKGSIGFDELVEKVPALGKTLDGARRAQELANKALEYWQQNLNEYANAMNQSMEMQLEANSLGRKAIDIQNKGSMELQRALGKEVTLREQVSSVLDSTSRQTKGISAPSAIGDSIVKLNDRRTVEQGMSDTAANRGASGKNEFMDMQQRLRNTNMALRENYDALKNMADNTEIASAALAKINEVQQKRQAGVNIAERLVTSSPEELSKLNSAMGRLSNNMAGIQNAGTTSDQRKESLDAFNMIAPLLGQDQGAMKANMLESMLGESGVGVSPMMKDVLDSLRNPEEDPMMREAIETYKMGVNLQSDANSELSRMSQLMSDNTAEVAAQKISESLSKTELSFETQIFDDIRTGIRRLVEIEEGKKDDAQKAQGKARGGLIYAAAGQMVDFAPKGTDTVPAMLTPGEFVVNRSATQKNLPLLKSINSNKYSTGGKVKYYNEGGYVGLADFAGMNSPAFSGTVAKDRGRRSLGDEEKETASSYPPVFNFPNKMTSISTAFGGSITAVAPPDQVGKVLSNYFYGKNDTEEAPQLNIGTPQSVLGPGVKELELYGDEAQKAGIFGNGLYPGVRFKKIGKTFDFGGSSNLDYKPIKLNQKDKYIELAKKYIDKLALSESVIQDINNIKYELPSPPQPILEYTEGGNRAFIGALSTPFGAKLKNLSEPIPSNFNYGLFSGDFEKQLQSYSKNKPAFYGFNIRTPFYPAYVSAGESTTTKGPWFDMDSSTFQNIYGTKEPHINPGLSSTNKLVSDNKEDVMKTVRLMADLDAAYNALTGGQKAKSGNAQFEETQDSLDNKKYIKNLEELYYGTKLSATFDSKEILRVPDEESQYPVTLYSPTDFKQDRWQKILDTVKENGSGYASTFSDGVKLRTFDKQGNPTQDPAKSFPYLDSIAADNQKITDIIRGVESDFSSDLLNANIVNAGSGVVDNGRYKFTYQKLKARFFNDTARRFMGAGQDLTNFIVVRDQAKESAGLNPFSDLGENQNIYVQGHDIETLLAELDNRNGEYGTPSAGQSGSPGPMYKPEDVIPYKYKLKKILKADNTGDLAGIEKSWAFKSDGSNNAPGLSDIELIAKSYTLAREQELLKGGLLEDKADTSKVFRESDAEKKKRADETDEAYKARMKGLKETAKEEAWTEAKRVTLGRAIYSVANQAGLRFNSAMPVSIPTVGGVAVELGQHITKMPTDSPQRAVLDSYRAFFAELYNNGETAKSSKEAAEGSDSGPFLKSLGIDISDGAFGPPGPMVRVPGSTTETQPSYYTSTKNDAAKINAVLARVFMGERSKQFAGALSDEKKEELTIDAAGTGAKIYTVNPDGTKSLKKGEEIVPKSYADIFDMALTPENLFPDANIRQQYLDQLISYYTTAANAQGQALFSPQMSEPFVNSLKVLQAWYKVQDTVLNASRTPEELLAIRGGLQAIKDGNIPPSLAEQFKNTTGLSTDDVKTQAEGARETAQEANAFLTTNKYGELPNLERMISLLNVQAAEKAQENERQTQTLSSGGVVYASTGKLINFQPRGTDTVPAMLTPGEFVVNRGATQKHLPVLEAINSGNYSRGDIVQHLSRGGVASGYYQVGGPANAGLAGFDFSSFMNSLVSQVSSAITEAAKSAFNSVAKSNTSSGGVSNSGNQNFDGISDFTSKLDRISSTLASLDIPREITITGRHDVNVVINGDEALHRLAPNIQDMISNQIAQAFDSLISKNQPVPEDKLIPPDIRRSQT